MMLPLLLDVDRHIAPTVVGIFGSNRKEVIFHVFFHIGIKIESLHNLLDLSDMPELILPKYLMCVFFIFYGSHQC